MHVVTDDVLRAFTVLLIVACGCASGAPEAKRQEGASTSDADEPRGAAGSSTAPRPEDPSGAAGGNAGAAGDDDDPDDGDPDPMQGSAGMTGSSDDDDEDDPLDEGDDPTQGAAGMAGMAGDAGGGSTSGMAGQGAGGAGAPAPKPEPEPGDCFDATLLWSDDFETGDYSRWTGRSYGADWGDACQTNGITTETSVSGTHAQRSEISCPYTGGAVHRGYGGLQFSGDQVLSNFTNAGTGTDAPNGVVNTMWMRLDSDTVFENGRWVSFFTVNADCTWADATDAVLGFGIEDASSRLAAAHYQFGAGGTRTFTPGAPTLPRYEWVRVTTYVNYHTGVMHVWQDGQSVQHVTFSRPLRTICHWHWGLYASADNDAIVLYEDDKSIWKLNEPWTDFAVEPYFGEEVAVCE